METRNVVCVRCSDVIATLEMPDGISEDEWSNVLSPYRCLVKPIDFLEEYFNTNNSDQVTAWQDVEHYDKLRFNINGQVGPEDESTNNDNHIVAVEHSADGISADGEVTTITGIGEDEDIDIENFKNIRYKVKTVEGNPSWVVISSRIE